MKRKQFVNYEYILREDGMAVITRYLGQDTSLEVPAKLDSLHVAGIGEDAFRECDFLQSVMIPDGMTYIGPSAFRNCPALKK